MVSNSNVIPIIEFDGSDYEYGSIWMKTLLKARGYWDIIDVGYNDFVDWNALSIETNKDTKEKEK